MRGMTRHIRRGLLVLTVCVMALSHANAAFAREAKRILVITSYNPDTKKMYTTLSDILQELKNKGENNIRLDIENLNCKGLSEGHEWKYRMADILNEHRLSPPDLIIPLGQEAWSSFLSQNSDIARRTPVMPALVSTNTLISQNDSCNIQTIQPKAVYYDEIQGFNIVGGIFYKYDIEKNLELTRQLFPNTKRIALITDFTLGGLAMQTHVTRHMKRHKDIELVLLDGRSNTMFEICNKLKNINGKNTVLWLGTWRIDSSENYSLTSTDDVLRKANPQIPAFSLSATGMGNWAIGGYTPEYTPQGKMLADMAIEDQREPLPYHTVYIYLRPENARSLQKGRCRTATRRRGAEHSDTLLLGKQKHNIANTRCIRFSRHRPGSRHILSLEDEKTERRSRNTERGTEKSEGHSRKSKQREDYVHRQHEPRVTHSAECHSGICESS